MSSKVIQLDMFLNEEAVRKSQADEDFKKIVTKSIRGLFARHNEMEFAFLELHKRIDLLTKEQANA